MKTLEIALCVLLGSTLGACSDDPVSQSAPVGITMQGRSNDVVAGKIVLEKSISTESGNPWGAFISDAENALGVPPSNITLDMATIILESSSTNVSDLGEVLDGQVLISFQTNNSTVLHPVASDTVSGAAIGTVVTMDNLFDYSAVSASEQTEILGGSFKVVFDADVHANFENINADADMLVTMTFSAFE